MILSPRCPIFRSDNGDLLVSPPCVAFITAAAPNAGAIAAQRAFESAQIDTTLHRRAEAVLALAAAHGYRNLVLGAWGCGVFKNQPAHVADAFMTHLEQPRFQGVFRRIEFAVYDPSSTQSNLSAFRERVEASTAAKTPHALR